MDGNDGDILWNDSEETRKVRKMKALTVQVETVILNGEGRQNLTCFVY
jgi:hypothetical protein